MSSLCLRCQSKKLFIFRIAVKIDDYRDFILFCGLQSAIYFANIAVAKSVRLEKDDFGLSKMIVLSSVLLIVVLVFSKSPIFIKATNFHKS